MSNFNVDKLPAVEGVAAGQTAFVQIPILRVFHRLLVRMKVTVGGADIDVPATDWGQYIGDIRLKIDGNVVETWDVASYLAYIKFQGEALVAGTLPIFLSQPWLRHVANEDLTSYVTQNFDTFTLEMDLKDGVVVPSGGLLVYGQTTAQAAQGNGTLLRQTRRQRVSFNSIGQMEIRDIPKAPYNLSALVVNSDKIDEIIIESEGITIYRTDKSLRASLAATRGKLIQPNFTVIDFASERRITGVTPMAVQDWVAKLTFTEAPNALDVYAVGLRSTGQGV